MLRMMILGLAMVATSATAQDSAQVAEKLLASWAPDDVTMSDDGTLRIVLPERRVTSEMYSSITRFGLCLGPIATGDMMEDVSSIEVLNQFEVQGFVYEKGLNDCETMSGTGAAAEMSLMSATHTFSPE